MTRDEIRNKIKEVCKHKGWSVADVARQSGISQRAIAGFLEGRERVSPQVLYKLCQALSLDKRS